MGQQTMDTVRVLRFFASDDAQRTQTLQELTADGKVRFQEMKKGSEALVALQCSLDEKTAMRLLDRCENTLRNVCSPALYATDDMTLPEATVAVLKETDKLFVAADAVTAGYIAPRLAKVAGAESVFDFGKQSYAHPRLSDRIEEGGNLGKGRDDLQLACQGRVREARKLSGADFALAVISMQDYEIILLGAQRGFWMRRVPQTDKTMLWMFDMLRRAALDQAQASGTSWQSYGTVLENESEEKTKDREKNPYSYLPPRETTPLRFEPAAPAVQNGPETQPDDVEEPMPQTPSKPLKQASSEPNSNPGKTLLLGLLGVILLAALTIGLLMAFSGGDPVTLWNSVRSPSTSLNGGATLL